MIVLLRVVLLGKLTPQKQNHGVNFYCISMISRSNAVSLQVKKMFGLFFQLPGLQTHAGI